MDPIWIEVLGRAAMRMIDWLLSLDNSIQILGLCAAALQALGYLVYVTQVLRSEIRPNAASWTMFAYGTTLLLFLEMDRGARWELLAVPAVCAISSILVAIYCLRRGGRLWPQNSVDRLSFVLDVCITIVYVSAWIMLTRGSIDEHQKSFIDLVLLICWNFGILTAFFPLLREVYRNPHSERSSPWLIWSIAYALLFTATIITQKGIDELALYPLVNMIVHMFVAHHARAHRRRRMLA